jgi:hypothetical protein
VSAGDVLIAVDGVSVLDTTTIRELQAAVRAAGRSDIYKIEKRRLFWAHFLNIEMMVV